MQAERNTSLKPLRVYLVEDSPILVRLLADLLSTDASIAVVGKAASARTAIEEIGILRPDVVVLDIALQNSSGFTVLKKFAPTDRKRPIFMMLSNLALEPYRRRAANLGARHFFDKNRQITEMLRAVVRLAHSSPRTRAAS
jgi:chemotaxis response regulator CheB